MAKKEIAHLQKEMAQIRQDKKSVEEQLEEALEAPISSPVATAEFQREKEAEIEIAKTKMEELRKENESIIAEKLEKEKQFQLEKEKLQQEMTMWKGMYICSNI